jgi:hypothetical protein
MRMLPLQFQPEADFIELVGIADLHYGSRQFNEKKAMKHRAYIMADPDRKVIDLGDDTENSLRASPGAAIFQQSCPPSMQRDWVKEYYRPIRERMVAVVASNHSDRSDREVDWNPDEALVAFLDCPYIRWEGVISITVGDSAKGQTYSIFTRHAFSNSAKPAQILNSMMAKSRSIQGCDIYLGAHTHQYLHHIVPTLVPDPRHKRIRKVEQHFIISDAFIEHDGSYAEQHSYPYPTEGQVGIRLYKDSHRIEVQRLVY